jgi:murein DD-endopeptidase MepM/ murein hydrolase activator NlpD
MRRRELACLIALVLRAGLPFSTSESITITAASRALEPGELVVLTITAPAAADGVRVRAFDRDVPAFGEGSRTWRALVGIDLDVVSGVHTVSVEARSGRGQTDILHTTYDLRVRPHAFPTRMLSVDEAFVHPPAEMQSRIQQEAAELQRIWKAAAPERLWSGAFVRPVPGQAVSRFGTRSVFNGQTRSPHSGADFISPAGTPIHAPNGGRVVLARELYFSGDTVVIDHGLGLYSLLAHLSAIDVHDGDRVSANQVVGRVGATGRVTGPHLHWAVRAGGARIDPLSVLALLGAR